ncbi:hypothetical protein [Streptomyces sp. RFCAC02]|uniref:hypothetical protein n=1 Tax=Streptomyces sp. RFCAC02 TaxID=2499143 RepID=UPI00102120C0|nr:hypothetical protein [Streptomyces sp. RFCAC02]
MDDMSEWLPLASKELNNYTVTPGVLGFIVFAVLGVGVWLLLKSMSRHLGRISVPEDAAAADVPAQGSTAARGENAATAGSRSS